MQKRLNYRFSLVSALLGLGSGGAFFVTLGWLLGSHSSLFQIIAPFIVFPLGAWSIVYLSVRWPVLERGAQSSALEVVAKQLAIVGGCVLAALTIGFGTLALAEVISGFLLSEIPPGSLGFVPM